MSVLSEKALSKPISEAAGVDAGVDAVSFPVAYYGWINVVVASIMMTFTLPGRTHGLGLMTKPLLVDLQIAGETYAWMNFFAVLLGSLFCIPIGKLVDRFGSRWVLTGVTLLFGIVTLWAAYVHDPFSFFLTLTMSRGLSQAGITVGASALVGKWFKRNLGYAMAFYSVLMAGLFMYSTGWAVDAVKSEGWRTTWIWMGIAIVAVVTPMVGFFIRSSPDADHPEIQPLPTDELAAKPAATVDYTMLQAVGEPTFWIFTLSFAMFAQAWSAITLFNELILEERGFKKDDTFKIMMMLLPASGLIAKLFVGWLVNNVRLGFVMGIGMALLAISMGSFPFVTQSWQVYLYAMGLGVSGTFIMVSHMAYYPIAFGRTNLGQVQGAAQVVAVVISASGPVVLEICKKYSGQYLTMFFSTAAIMLVLCVLAATMPLPRPKLDSAE